MSDKTYLRLTVSDRVRELEATGKGSRQFTVKHSSVLQVLALGGLDADTRLSKKNPLQLTCVTPKGTEFQVVQGDTHAVHLTHQTDNKAREVLDWAWEQEGEIAFEVTSVDKTELEKTPDTVISQRASMKDCPF